jgi:hypothetical protein
MYVVVDGVKQDPVRRWSLPDRVFFACGACHILAFAFLKAYPHSGFAPLWIKPSEGFTGNHIVVVRDDDVAFDYHGFSRWSHLLGHMEAKANRWWPGWSAQLIPLPMEVLISESKSREYDGLWLREPKQFLHDAMPRAEQYLCRFPGPPERPLQVPKRPQNLEPCAPGKRTPNRSTRPGTLLISMSSS